MIFFTMQMLFCKIFKKTRLKQIFPSLRKYEDEEYAVRQIGKITKTALLPPNVSLKSSEINSDYKGGHNLTIPSLISATFVHPLRKTAFVFKVSHDPCKLAGKKRTGQIEQKQCPRYKSFAIEIIKKRCKTKYIILHLFRCQDYFFSNPRVYCTGDGFSLLGGMASRSSMAR